ncbi:hypothetical protein ACFQV8_14060 [Pseudonocardia benzenivorans]
MTTLEIPHVGAFDVDVWSRAAASRCSTCTDTSAIPAGRGS